jgi:hypothetical protein
VSSTAVDEVLAGYDGLKAGQEALCKDRTSIPSSPTRSTAALAWLARH